MKTAVQLVFVSSAVLLSVFLGTVTVCDATIYANGDIVVFLDQAGAQAVKYDGSNILENTSGTIVGCLPVTDARHEFYANLVLGTEKTYGRDISHILLGIVKDINEKKKAKEEENKVESSGVSEKK
ncbi:uncharacterized protein LOC126844567 [Adelges cooleyi]|uniref:uncharacterized protein LOC126844567 n=1 Tax=Adelges cooleyi TaxID=133065 RepID=UPI00218030A9|nr:uncharacterized protein LOC126844567 [Adelges cooleyi]